MLNPDNVKDNAYIYFGKKSNAKYPKFKVGDHVRISKYKNCFFYLFKSLFTVGIQKQPQLINSNKIIHSKLVRRSFCD